METDRIAIEGELSIATVAAFAPLLAARLADFRERGGGSGDGRLRVDLAGAGDIDLSGWQLLALWFRHVRSLGFDPALVNVRGEQRRRLEILGLAREFAVADGAGGEGA